MPKSNNDERVQVKPLKKESDKHWRKEKIKTQRKNQQIRCKTAIFIIFHINDLPLKFN
ncbi:Uncharacterised protein [Serratia grimesii]|nr:Uncharacterised protein [Serratia grimesii]CAI1852362.1 Uncharacterised protein [Serratia grimesii]CAI2420372.1 Uncharacterised protein [Serratia grimesii]SUI34974.1 Uncharacterised protein [Serratia grimesii]